MALPLAHSSPWTLLAMNTKGQMITFFLVNFSGMSLKVPHVSREVGGTCSPQRWSVPSAHHQYNNAMLANATKRLTNLTMVF